MSVSLRLGAKILTGIDVRTSATWYALSVAVTCGRPAARRKIGFPFTTVPAWALTETTSADRPGM